jgi:serine/threonine-protein kinase HipA
MVVHELARAAGLDVAEARLEAFGGKGSRPGHRTFLSRRFDRTDDRRRVHFTSAMTMLGRSDGEAGHDGASYVDLAGVLMQFGERANEDLEQLWRRVVFFVCVSNTDDHLRNHGFLLGARGVRLAPAYDVNPDPDGDGLTLNVSESDNAQDLDLVLSVAELFRLRPARARVVADEVVAAVRSWQTVADRYGLGRPQQQRMARAFRLADG